MPPKKRASIGYKRKQGKQGSAQKENVPPVDLAGQLVNSNKREKLQALKITGLTSRNAKLRAENTDLRKKKDKGLQEALTTVRTQTTEINSLNKSLSQSNKQNDKLKERVDKLATNLSQVRSTLRSKRWYDKKVRMDKIKHIRENERVIAEYVCFISLFHLYL